MRADGHVLYEYPVSVKPLSCTPPGQDRLALVGVVLAVQPDARVIEILFAQVYKSGGCAYSYYNVRLKYKGFCKKGNAWEVRGSD
jgi:hypothetical protein